MRAGLPALTLILLRSPNSPAALGLPKEGPRSLPGTNEYPHPFRDQHTEMTDYWKLFKAKPCSVGLKATDQPGVFKEIVTNLVKAGHLEESLTDAANRALLERESLASTGLGRNVAIPHVKLKGIEQPVVSVSIHKTGVDWNALDGELVHVFFTVLRPEGETDLYDPERHLGMMKWIAKLSQDGDFRRFAAAAKTKKELVDLLKEKANV